ncbi:hypothetical protein PFICI_03566 [Pestalotiopsis fici W106-1]|uniref:ORC6 first cyclin-like domain-containing protein n=1 Tax=Pestalotiopsis fici (strain W106-1 / CGMCC3.15140) TaxID=1229662 RepID=W3XJV9_PESFW|nr:uncharacterized protein PFICI_03566 [Pestalotiopsis fici W106-1]ETS85541.1 hypothetical protein PFICI_03566 [Pestalotiopsis fici W106-1]
MSRSLEPTLLSLLPSLNSASSLPPSLVELASSLLAQSRHNASTLKAEEEVARLYACAHIACERLKTTLDLPPIQARPPVPPRVYKRLYTHLDRILPTSSPTKRTRTPSGKAREAGLAFGSEQRTRERATPGKEAALAAFRPKSNGTPTKSTGKAVVPSTGRKARDVLPSWMRPTAQYLCTHLDSEHIGRTVLAGLQSIITPHGKRSKDEWINDHLAALFAGVFFLVTTRYMAMETKRPISSTQYGNLRRDIVKVFRQAREEVKRNDEDEEVFWEGWSKIGAKDVDDAAKVFAERGWQDGEWFAGIQGKGDSQVDAEMEDAQDHGGGEKAQVQHGDSMLLGRWTMTDQKRRDYADWKADILDQCLEIEKAGQAMDVDVSA